MKPEAQRVLTLVLRAYEAGSQTTRRHYKSRKIIVIEEANFSFGLIQLLDRGGLKCPLQLVFASVCTLWKVFIQIGSPLFF